MNENFHYNIDIKSHFKTYNVEFSETLSDVMDFVRRSETFFVLDNRVFDLYRDKLPCFPKERLFLVEANENKKNIWTVLDICEKMTNMPSKRNTHIISIGGGIIQDITGFVASCLYRGIYWTFYPTTLLAACDSCIGGKSSLNYKGFKNLLGSFYPPDKIKIYSQFFHTLTLRDYCSGLGEVVKFNTIIGESGIEHIEKDIDEILKHNYMKLFTYIRSSLEFKKNFIEEDEFDKNSRILLNFAHTFGHAYETTSEYKIPHGLAVVLGMVTANNISVQRKFISIEYAARIEKICRKILQDIEIKKEWFILNSIISAIHKDKKQTNQSITAILLKNNHQLDVFKDIRTSEIDRAISHLIVELDIN
ncbi:AroB-related putative sugar phosphate phospholyase (cyclizing) [Pectinatus haikarae]|uniref:3-dehydroquinate synthase n=1 Tax=Pectinatus haikarae TaxID=349096 RepID=A0ABT9YD71_9FIRM|nr:AroB-related putative sugar phosphate phospholyase (cyclizing) [Pectinatus haikarae]MDQ0205137.1 3-dehydroquinate synthase [Pectinatus haikarae]